MGVNTGDPILIIWINGAFGAGKTQAAHALARRLPQSFVCDPEQLGFGLQRMTPPKLRGDFQDLPEWRAGVVSRLAAIDAAFGGVLIVPMTLVNPDYYDETVGQLRRQGHDVRHVALLASRATLLGRLRSRAEGPDSWGAQQIERCLQGLSGLDASEHLPTDALNHQQVVDEIGCRCQLDLLPDTRTPLQQRWQRLLLKIRSARGD